MNPYQKDVGDFMRVMEQPTPATPTLDNYPFLLRVKLIVEEAMEFAEASRIWVAVHEDDGSLLFDTHGVAPWPTGYIGLNDLPSGPPDMVAMIDALCDILYVTFGAAEAMGIDLDDFFAEVQASNMRKATGPVRSDGKRLKPEGWVGPDIAGILKRLKEK